MIFLLQLLRQLMHLLLPSVELDEGLLVFIVEDALHTLTQLIALPLDHRQLALQAMNSVLMRLPQLIRLL